jgi:hypothetical protein
MYEVDGSLVKQAGYGIDYENKYESLGFNELVVLVDVICEQNDFLRIRVSSISITRTAKDKNEEYLPARYASHFYCFFSFCFGFGSG